MLKHNNCLTLFDQLLITLRGSEMKCGEMVVGCCLICHKTLLIIFMFGLLETPTPIQLEIAEYIESQHVRILV